MKYRAVMSEMWRAQVSLALHSTLADSSSPLLSHTGNASSSLASLPHFDKREEPNNTTKYKQRCDYFIGPSFLFSGSSRKRAKQDDDDGDNNNKKM
uniref:Uncharacterized protein n=1 Tax=Oryza barthii TaxID=65489 RepID=A0A0D3EKT6_9ORYZ